MSDKQSPGFLTHLAVNKLVDSLQHSSQRLDNFIASEIQKRSKSSVSPYSSKQIPNQKNPAKLELRESIADSKTPTTEISKTENCNACPLDQGSCAAAAALQMMNIRSYMLEFVTSELQPLVIRHVIARAIESRNIALVRLVLKDGVNILDFRALDYWLSRCIIPDHLLQQSKSYMNPQQTECAGISGSSTSFPLAIHCLPPDEFDWFARDRFGKIISIQEACELFSIISMSQCAENCTELYMNSRRATYWACGSRDLMEIIADNLLNMKKLSTLVLRGMADDYMLKLVGKTATGLKSLDVSGSQFVTDEGIQNLIFKKNMENPATYLKRSWIKKNMELMNPLVLSLETLDYSYTSVTSLSRKTVQILPGSYMFRRIFARTDNDAYGHHIFIRRKAEFNSEIRLRLDNEATEFETGLRKLIGQKPSKSLIKFMENHPWQNSILTVHKESSNNSNESLDGSKAEMQLGLITSNNERQVQGVLNFQDGQLTEIYSVYPINMNLLGETCSKLRVFRGILNETWKMKSSFLPKLTCLDMFADPSTITSVLQSVPNLKKVRIRVIGQTLTDDHIIKSITQSMCQNTLEELWIAPGSYRNSDVQQPPKMKQDNQEEYHVATMNLQSKKPISKTENLTTDDASKCPIEDLVNLSIECIRTLINFCPNMLRLGDIAWYSNTTQEDLEEICNEIKCRNSRMAFVWENHIFPDMTKDITKSTVSSIN